MLHTSVHRLPVNRRRRHPAQGRVPPHPPPSWGYGCSAPASQPPSTASARLWFPCAPELESQPNVHTAPKKKQVYGTQHTTAGALVVDIKSMISIISILEAPRPIRRIRVRDSTCRAYSFTPGPRRFAPLPISPPLPDKKRKAIVLLWSCWVILSVAPTWEQLDTHTAV